MAITTTIITTTIRRRIPTSNGAEAIAQFESDEPNTVLLDIAMPTRNGLSALKAIRSIDPHARVTMLTALGQRDIVEQAGDAGAMDFVAKPCTRSGYGPPSRGCSARRAPPNRTGLSRTGSSGTVWCTVRRPALTCHAHG